MDLHYFKCTLHSLNECEIVHICQFFLGLQMDVQVRRDGVAADFVPARDGKRLSLSSPGTVASSGFVPTVQGPKCPSRNKRDEPMFIGFASLREICNESPIWFWSSPVSLSGDRCCLPRI